MIPLTREALLDRLDRRLWRKLYAVCSDGSHVQVTHDAMRYRLNEKRPDRDDVVYRVEEHHEAYVGPCASITIEPRENL